MKNNFRNATLSLCLLCCAVPAAAQSKGDSIAEACYYKAYELENAGLFDSAVFWINKGLDTITDKSAEFGLYHALCLNRANCVAKRGYLDSAISLYRIFETSLSPADTGYRAIAFQSMGVYFNQLGQRDSAVIYYGKALSYALDCDDKILASDCYSNLSILYHEQGLTDKALRSAELGMEYGSASGDPDTELSSLLVYVEVRQRTTPLPELQPYIDRGLALCDELSNDLFKLRLLTVLVAKADPDSLDGIIASADRIASALPPANVALATYLTAKANRWFDEGQYRKLLPVMLSLKSIYEQSGLDAGNRYLGTLRMLASAYDSLGDYKNSNKYLNELAVKMQDNFDADMARMVSEFSVKYDTKLKELKIASLEKDNIRKNSLNMLLGTSLAMITMIVGAALLYMRSRNRRLKSESELRSARRYIEGMEHEKTRIAKELHDGVCNDLLGISYVVSSVPPDEESRQSVLDLIKGVRNDVRFISHELMPPRFRNVTLGEALQSFIMQMSSTTGISVSFECLLLPDEMKSIPESISYDLYRIVQELLSNSMRYSGAAGIFVRLGRRDGNFALEYMEEGTDFPRTATASGQGGGIGLDTMKERLLTIGAVVTEESDGNKSGYVIVFGGHRA